MTTILVVDDAVLDQRLAGACVEKRGLTPIYASNGREALEVIARDCPDIVLTDLQMPEMDGLELVRRINNEYPNLPAMLMTAKGSEQIAMEALNAGAASYVPKKNLAQQLQEALTVVLATVEATRHQDQVRDFLQRSETTYVLGYQENGPAALVSHLQRGLVQLGLCNKAGLFQVSTAVTEALANAIDHGNLELDSALRESSLDAYRKLGRERAQQPPYRDRQVQFTEVLTPQHVTYTVRDEGPGFDPSDLPDPTDPENLLKPSGRGILLISTFMDKIAFSEQGNEITMTKYRCAE